MQSARIMDAQGRHARQAAFHCGLISLTQPEPILMTWVRLIIKRDTIHVIARPVWQKFQV